jgi:RNA polymerase sigma factor (sigma-70 family)
MQHDKPGTLVTDAAGETELEETRRRVREALVSLDERTRMLLVLRHEGYSYRGLAQALGVKESTIGGLLARASATFQAAFDEAGNQKGPP